MSPLQKGLEPTRSLPCRHLVLLLLALLWSGATAGAGSGPVSMRAAPSVVSFNVDAVDYNQVADRLASSLLEDRRVTRRRGSVLALGPVDTDGMLYQFDPRTFQEKLQKDLHRSGKLEVTFAVDAVEDHSAARARYDIMRLQWEKESTVDPEDLRTFGQLSNVDFLLFGRVSTQSSRTAGSTEVTYTYNWKLGDCRTGLLIWADEFERTKSGPSPQLPAWISKPRADSPGYLYAMGHAGPAADRQKALDDAVTRGSEALADRINQLMPPEAGIIAPVQASHIEVTRVPSGQHVVSDRAGVSAWVLLRSPRAAIDQSLAERRQAIERWRRASALLRGARRDPGSAIELLHGLVREYPLGNKKGIVTEQIVFRIAEIQLDEANPCAARTLYTGIVDRSPSGHWRESARNRLATIRCEAADRRTFALRRGLTGRRVSVNAAYLVGGKARRWSKMEDELTSAVRAAGGKPIRSGKRLPPRDIVDAAHAESVPAAAGGSAEDTLIAVADGDIHKRDNPKNPNGQDFRFSGDIIVLMIRTDGTVEFADQYSGMSGWNPIGERMVLDVVALMATKRWKEKYISSLGY